MTAYNRQVLLAGQVLDEKSKADAEALARVQQNVGNVFNELEVRPIATLSTRSNDTALSGKVRAALVAEQGVPSGTIRVTTENSVVFLMGRVTAAEGDRRARGLAPVGRGARGQAVRGALSAPSAVSGIALHWCTGAALGTCTAPRAGSASDESFRCIRGAFSYSRALPPPAGPAGADVDPARAPDAGERCAAVAVTTADGLFMTGGS